MQEDTILWAKQHLQKLDQKMQLVAKRSYNKLPYTALSGVHDDMAQANITWWTNGFWPGLMWLMYIATQNDAYKSTAEHAEELLDRAFSQYNGLHHDVGFMWNLSSGIHHRLLQDENAYTRMMLAANLLAGRYQINGGYIRAWNDGIEGEHNVGWSIIDCMMNLPLLYRASDCIGDGRFRAIAMAHADKTMQHHVRADGSVRHIVEYNPQNGDFVQDFAGQGYACGSSWSRGQAWALYGFALSYAHTQKDEYLQTAKRVAHYFIANLQNDPIPVCDFRSPKTPLIYDSTAGAIAACGFLEIAKFVSDPDIYTDAALSILKALSARCCDWSIETDALLTMGTERYHSEKGRHIPLIYGDYFFAEALVKISLPDFLAW